MMVIRVMKRMQLILWTLIQLGLSMASSSDILLETTLDVSTGTIFKKSEDTTATQFFENPAIEDPESKSNLSSIMEIVRDKKLYAVPSTFPEVSYKPLSNSDESKMAYQSTTANMIHSLSAQTQIEISTLPNFDKDAHYEAGLTTKSNESAEIPDIVINTEASESTDQVRSVSKITDQTIFDDVLHSIQNSENYDLNNKTVTNLINITIPTETEDTVERTKTNLESKRIRLEDIEIYDNATNDYEKDLVKVTETLPSENTTEIDALFLLINRKELPPNLKHSVVISKAKETTNKKFIKFPEVFEENIDDSFNATETNTNSTRNPKTFYGERPGYYDNVRPSQGGYARPDVIDRVRPLHPDPIDTYPYYRPTPDSRTPIVVEKDNTRPSRPGPDYQRVSFRPNYSLTKSTQDDVSSYKSTTVEAVTPKNYRPSFKPYHPHSSFGRPYHPEYHRPPAPKPSEENTDTIKLGTDAKGTSSQGYDVSDFSRLDYAYTKLFESSSTSSFHTDIRPSALRPDITESYRPPYDSKIGSYNKHTSLSDSKISKPNTETSRPSAFYPRPGFGYNYQTSGTSSVPFSVGTVVAAKNLTKVEFIKADCFDNHMKVTMRFNGTFSGLVYSSGYAQDSSCSYVNGTGRNNYEFFIRLNRCGTIGQQEVANDRRRPQQRRREERAQYLVNTITVQYNPVIEEDVDEHFRVTCEYGYDFWKTVTFPIMNVESPAVKVRTGSPVVFTLPPPQCNMEIRRGYGLTGSRVSGPVNVGDPLTLVIHMKSESAGFDILVSNCYAHNGGQKRLQLIDSNGCVAEEQIVSNFRGIKGSDRRQQITLYSFLKAFRFTGSPALYIECDVHMCHGTCPPQRCYWRKVHKRSADEEIASNLDDSLMSESISLFQALEVRHEEVDQPHLLALRNSSVTDMEDMLCLRTGGFAAMLACILLLLLLTTTASVCLCLRMQKMKRFSEEAPDTKHFVEFVSHDSFK